MKYQRFTNRIRDRLISQHMHLEHDISLRNYNTFGIDVPAANLFILEKEADLSQLPYLKKQYGELHILGGGSNVLLTKPVEGLVVLNRLRGITSVKESEDFAWLGIAAGEIWHDVVLYAINRGLGGIENLALIPGTMGAAPIQNVGAYGVEVKDAIDTVTFYHLDENRLYTLGNTACCFAYRDSIFKQELKGKALVTSVTLKLNKKPEIRTSYGAIQQELEAMRIVQPTIKDVAEAVMRIRRSKLPDPVQIGNAGSFFKNPVIPEVQLLALKSNNPDIPYYVARPGFVKVPAGWLIEQCGWKGKTIGHTGVHAKQALVLVNYAGASGAEIWALSEEIVYSVHQRFGIELEREVQVW